MSSNDSRIPGEVIGIFPNHIKIAIDNIEDFSTDENPLKIGSYIQIFDNQNTSLIAIIQNYHIEMRESGIDEFKRISIIDAFPLGTLFSNGKFKRGGDELAIPPKTVNLASKEALSDIFLNYWNLDERFIFCNLSYDRSIKIPINGNLFFNKHIAIVGATGSGKSNVICRIIQNMVQLSEKNQTNNTHVIIFDIHSEYPSSFPNANIISINDLILPYWLLNADEIEELFLESGDHNNYNQASLLRSLISINKKIYNPDKSTHFDTPHKYEIEEIICCLKNFIKETVDSSDPSKVKISGEEKEFNKDEDRITFYFSNDCSFEKAKTNFYRKGPYADGSIDKFAWRFQSKVNNPRLKFLFGDEARKATFEEVITRLMGYFPKKLSNVTIFDLSGVPFEVLSITVSIITRLLFDYGYQYKKLKKELDAPYLLVYEEAHRYAPKSELSKYRASKTSIERIAKEGRKYGISLLISSQRPSEISETIFSQCSNFIVMRLTNPDDQNYVKRLLPDNLGELTLYLSSFESGEGLIIGDSIIMPTIVYFPIADPCPSSEDIKFFDLWKKNWFNLPYNELLNKWEN